MFLSKLTNYGLVWIRNDLRLTDHPALHHAVLHHDGVILVFILDETVQRHLGGAQGWWLHHSLHAFQKSCQNRGIPLILKRGSSESILMELCERYPIRGVYWNRRYEPDAVQQDKKIKAELKRREIHVDSFKSSVILEPWEIKNKSGDFFKVFTPFYRAHRSLVSDVSVLPVPSIVPMSWKEEGDSLDDWALLPTHPNWASGFECWKPGEEEARMRLMHFIEGEMMHYSEKRDVPEYNATSKLSPHLHFGEISPRQVFQAIMCFSESSSNALTSRAAEAFLRQLIWREFSYHFLHHIPQLVNSNFRSEFDRFPWASDDQLFSLWKKGQTGYPIVDAGMRELWTTGYMHNRVRMIAASFLTKHLLMDWREGEVWFWHTLLDADLANNVMNWQWVAGCGADAAPYYRIFNPILQGEKFDPEGRYVKRWVPELASLPSSFIHQPWSAPNEVLRSAGIVLGKTYPHRVVEHSEARERALAALASIKKHY